MRVEDLLGRYERPRGEATVVFGGEKVSFVIQAVTGDRFDEVKAEHPPTEQDWDRYQRVARAKPLLNVSVPDIHLPTAIPILLGEGMVSVDGEPVSWGPEDGRQLWAALSDGDRAELQEVVWSVNNERDDRPLSKPATEGIDPSGSGSIMPVSEEFPSPDTPEGSTGPNGAASTVMSSTSG